MMKRLAAALAFAAACALTAACHGDGLPPLPSELTGTWIRRTPASVKIRNAETGVLYDDLRSFGADGRYRIRYVLTDTTTHEQIVWAEETGTARVQDAGMLLLTPDSAYNADLSDPPARYQLTPLPDAQSSPVAYSVTGQVLTLTFRCPMGEECSVGSNIFQYQRVLTP